MNPSSHSACERAIFDADGAVPLTWARGSRALQITNLGDALSPVIVVALSGLRVKYADRSSPMPRMSAIGTIGQKLAGGTVHIWGTGFDATRNAVDDTIPHYILPPGTTLLPYAVRGPFSRCILADVGIDVPAVYGDPAWFLPRIHAAKVQKKAELGVVLHLSELAERSCDAVAKPQLKRCGLSEADASSIKIINTYHRPNYSSLTDKLDEILSCKRIVSTSFHGMMLADAYRIPCAFFSPSEGGGTLVDPFDHHDTLNHRFADFYAGCSRKLVPVYRQRKNHQTDWASLIRFIDDAWTPVEDEFQDLLAAFPLTLKVDPAQASWGDAQSLADIPFSA